MVSSTRLFLAVFAFLAPAFVVAASAATTLSLFVDGIPGENFAASVVSAGCGTTQLAISCTSGTFGTGQFTRTCGEVPAVTALYYGSTGFAVTTGLSKSSIVFNAMETCAISGTTEVVCQVSESQSFRNSQTSTALTTTLTGDRVNFYGVAITAGADKLASATSCTTAKSNARPTAAAELIKVIVVPGAAVLLAGAAML